MKRTPKVTLALSISIALYFWGPYTLLAQENKGAAQADIPTPRFVFQAEFFTLPGEIAAEHRRLVQQDVENYKFERYDDLSQLKSPLNFFNEDMSAEELIDASFQRLNPLVGGQGVFILSPRVFSLTSRHLLLGFERVGKVQSRLYFHSPDVRDSYHTPSFSPNGQRIMLYQGLPPDDRRNGLDLTAWNISKGEIYSVEETERFRSEDFISFDSVYLPVSKWSPGSRYVSYMRGGTTFGEYEDHSPYSLFCFDFTRGRHHALMPYASLEWSWTYHGTILCSWWMPEVAEGVRAPIARVATTPETKDKEAAAANVIPQGAPRPSVYEVDAASGKPHKLFDGGYFAHESPDGKWIAFGDWPGPIAERQLERTGIIAGREEPGTPPVVKSKYVLAFRPYEGDGIDMRKPAAKKNVALEKALQEHPNFDAPKVPDEVEKNTKRGVFLFEKATGKRFFIGELPLREILDTRAAPIFQWSPDGHVLYVLWHGQQGGTVRGSLFKADFTNFVPTDEKTLPEWKLLSTIDFRPTGRWRFGWFEGRGISSDGKRIYLDQRGGIEGPEHYINQQYTLLSVDTQTGVSTPIASLKNIANQHPNWDFIDESGPNPALLAAEKLENAKKP